MNRGCPGQPAARRLLGCISEGAYPLPALIAERTGPMDLTALDGLCKNVDSGRVGSNTERGKLENDRRG
jgi:hypothetical protein